MGYSYWRNINNHIAGDTMYIVLGFDRNRGGAGPSLIAYDKIADHVQNLGPLFPMESPYSYSTTEGWYFSATAASLGQTDGRGHAARSSAGVASNWRAITS